MKRRWNIWMAGLAATAVMLSGCSSDIAVTAESQTKAETKAETKAGTKAGTEAESEPGKEPGDSFRIGDLQVQFQEEDYDTEWSEEESTYIHLDDTAVSIEGTGAAFEEDVLLITEGGTYVLNGTWSDGSVQVDAKGKGTVRLVLNGVDIHSEESAAIYVLQADKTVITLAEDTVNTVSDSAGLVYTDTEKEEPNAALFSKNDLTINGTGTLIVNGGFKHGINGKDNLILMSGTYQVTSVGSAFKGKDLLVVRDGVYEISAGNDGMHSDGSLGILDGTIRITESTEGIEGGTILIAGGDISVKSTDDGINAASDEDITPTLYLDGGTVVVDASGDGIDSNGDIYMTGGEVTVYGPASSGDGALDYDGIFEISGGSLAAFGMSGMAQSVSSGSVQNAVMMTYESRQQEGTEVVLKTEDGQELYRWTGEKEFDSLVISVPELTVDETYVLETEEEPITFVLEYAMTYLTRDGVSDQESRRGRPGSGGGAPEGRPENGADGDREGRPGGGQGGEAHGERPDGQGRKPSDEDGEMRERPDGQK